MRGNRFIVIVLCLISGLGQVSGDSDNAWQLSTAGSMAVADGNSESLAWSIQLLAEYEGEIYDARIGFDHFYSSSNSVESSNSYKLHQQLSRDLNENWYVSQYASALTDAVADIDYRIDGSFLLGRHLLQSEKAQLSLEFGPGYAWEEKAGDDNDYMTARLGQRFEYQCNDDLRLWQSLTWTPQVEDFSNSVVEFELGLENRLNGRLSMRSFIRHRVDSDPASGSGSSDTALLMGLKYAIGNGDEVNCTAGTDFRTGWLSKAIGSGDSDWVTTVAMGLTYNRGNADKTGLQFDWESDLHTDDLEIGWELDHQIAEDGGRTTTDRTSSSFQINWIDEDPDYVGFALSFLRDDLADIQYRISPSLLVGRYLIKDERIQLSLELGPRYTVEQTGQGWDDYFSLLMAQRLEYKISERTSLDQSIEISTPFDEPDDYTLATKLALDTKLNDKLSWRWELVSRYESLPVIDRDHHDLLFTSGVALSF